VLEHGHWPTKLYIDDRVYEEHLRTAYDGHYNQSDRELLIAISAKLQILPERTATYRAEDDEGRQYDYGKLGFASAACGGRLVLLWLIGQRPALPGISQQLIENLNHFARNNSDNAAD
jgi:hypothetical protein